MKAVYSEIDGRAIIRFFVNDVNVLVHDFPIVTGENLYLVVSSKKLSPQSIDTSRNYMKVYSTCIVNLPVPRTDITNQSSTQKDDYMYKLIVFTNIAILLVMLYMFFMMVRLSKLLKRLTYKS